MVRQRLIRDEAPLPDDAVLIRLLFDGYADGSAFDRATLIGDANLNFAEFGYYGLSMWGAVGSRSLESVLASKCRFSRWVALYRAADLRDNGLAIVPNGVAPHYDASAGAVYGHSFGSVQITAPSAEDLIDRFIAATYTGMQNKYFTARPS
ncbi:hypothetical protein [Pengzhenrongella sicca]|uniref:Uncharacterized protein n=1 Tax=Pengzhenrongella sicca TaxID=2819238 RepID=A0A8A4ZBY6_9MICO|nr:hypothetical protein [Pengzhenrongella sicca]QTE28931.1 hypothetical protein J4E96_16650 [Pengzhenrongella sicca]